MWRRLKQQCRPTGWRWQTQTVCRKADLTLPTKVRTVKTMVFPVVTYGCEGWTVKKAECQRIDAFEPWCWRLPESPLDSKEIKLGNHKGDQPWVFIGRTGAEAEVPVFWSSDANRKLTGKVPDAGKDWGQKKRVSEDEMARQHHRWTRTWANSGRWWGTGRPGVLQFMGSQRVRHDRVTEQKQEQLTSLY